MFDLETYFRTREPSFHLYWVRLELPTACSHFLITGTRIVQPSSYLTLSLCSVTVQFKQTGSAPVLAQTKFKIPAARKFGALNDFLRKTLNVAPSDPLVWGRVWMDVKMDDGWAGG